MLDPDIELDIAPDIELDIDPDIELDDEEPLAAMVVAEDPLPPLLPLLLLPQPASAVTAASPTTARPMAPVVALLRMCCRLSRL